MWQRTQTIYFVLVILLMIAAVLIPNADFFNQAKNITYRLDARGIVELTQQGTTKGVVGTNPCTYFFGIILFLTTYCIASYKNRKRQLRMATINLFLIVIYIAILAVYIFFAKNKLEADITWKYPVIFPVIALIFNYLAMRGIAKDENLVKSLDRLR